MTINVFGGGNTGGPAFPVQRSVRLRSSASAYFSRTPASAGNRKTWTWSGWVKRGTLGTNQMLFMCNNGTTDATFGAIDFISDSLNISAYATAWRTTTQVFRDPAAWYHIVVAFDTTQATATDRVKVYVNGIQVTSFSTTNNPTQNTDYAINQAAAHAIAQTYGTYGYFDGYLTEINFIDGQALTPSSFGSINSTTGVWQPIKYSGTYGTNGFYLNFNDNSAATAAAIGKDSSGNGNNWTPNNISVTAGVTYDSMLDVPTLTSSTNANFAVLNPLDKLNMTAVPANGNLTLTAANDGGIIACTIGMSSGKWYYEHTITAVGGQQSVGIGTSVGATANSSAYVGFYSNQYGYFYTGSKYNNATSSAYGASYTTGDVIGVAYDADAGSLTFYKNGTSQGVAFTSLTGTMFPLAATRTTSGTNISNLNFGQRPFTYTPPSGFKSLNTYNLPAPTIPNGATQFAATTYTGVGSSLAISNTVNGKSFQPDLVWVKGRSGATDHALYDSVRGTTKQLESNTTTAETTEATGLTAFDTGGFTVGALAQMNTNTATYVGWQWKASNAAPVTNTSGSITSSVSANPSAGFSIVTYTGTGANATVGHGLGVAPKMVIVKLRSGVQDWIIWQTALAGTEYLLFTTAAKATAATFWNSTTPTSSVFSIGASGATNTPSGTYVAYCFSEIAGYSKFGSYTGNGSADGPFVYLGFRPRWVMVKSTGVNGWVILDTSRSTYNLALAQLIPNLSNAEDTTNDYFRCDILSNGFKLRTTGTPSNANGVSFIYAAFAESPFNYSLAR